MGPIILGIMVLVLLLVVLRGYTALDPRKLGRAVRNAGGLGTTLGAVGALGLAGVLAARGQFGIAIPLGLTGLGLLGWLPFGPAGFGARTSRSDGQVSRVRSAFVEMELEHDTGAMHGRILAGRHEGKSLDILDVPTLVACLAEIDEDSRALLMAYLDRRSPAWRDNVDGDPAAGARRSSWSSGKMTEEEAYRILGVQPGTSAEEIGRAHRTLMKKLHPDQGGSTYLAARVNEAKDVLLRRHR